MSCLTAAREAEITARRDQLVLIITELETAMLTGAATSYISNYELDTGAGKQKVTYKNINEMIKGLKELQALVDYYNSKLAGKGIINMNLTRRACGY